MACSYVVVTELHYGREYSAYAVPGDVEQCPVDEESGGRAKEQLWHRRRCLTVVPGRDLVLVVFLCPERGAGCISVSPEKAGRRMLHAVSVVDKKEEIVRVRKGGSGLSSRRDTCPVLHQPRKPPRFPG